MQAITVLSIRASSQVQAKPLHNENELTAEKLNQFLDSEAPLNRRTCKEQR
jgi:hypothetical protein